MIAEWAIYPRRRDPALAINLCSLHRGLAYDLKEPKQDLYSSANSVVTNSLSK